MLWKSCSWMIKPLYMYYGLNGCRASTVKSGQLPSDFQRDMISSTSPFSLNFGTWSRYPTICLNLSELYAIDRLEISHCSTKQDRLMDSWVSMNIIKYLGTYGDSGIGGSDAISISFHTDTFCSLASSRALTSEPNIWIFISTKVCNAECDVAYLCNIRKKRCC